MKRAISFLFFYFLMFSSFAHEPSDSTDLNPSNFKRPRTGPILLAYIQDIYVTYLGNSVDIPYTCPNLKKPEPTCAIINVDYAYCNISSIELNYSLVPSMTAPYKLNIVGNAASSGWPCNSGTKGFRGLHATCSIYCPA